jgi:hypothetical protein
MGGRLRGRSFKRAVRWSDREWRLPAREPTGEHKAPTEGWVAELLAVLADDDAAARSG